MVIITGTRYLPCFVVTHISYHTLLWEHIPLSRTSTNISHTILLLYY